MDTIPQAELGHVNKNVNPEREAMGDALADILSMGYTLTTEDFKEITTHYGYSPNTSVNFIIGLPGFKAIASEKGIDISTVRYRGRLVYYNQKLSLDDTDIEHTMQRIDAVKAAQKDV